MDINAYAGQTVQFRFRLGTDTGVGREGWTIDDVIVQSCQAACPYNVNGSGGVDIVDMQLVAGAFGTNSPAYDFDARRHRGRLRHPRRGRALAGGLLAAPTVIASSDASCGNEKPRNDKAGFLLPCHRQALRLRAHTRRLLY